MFQTKQTPEKTLMKEVSNPPDKEFKEAIIIMPTKLERRMEELSDNFDKDLENIRKPITSEEYNNWKITLEGIKKLDEIEEQICDL